MGRWDGVYIAFSRPDLQIPGKLLLFDLKKSSKNVKKMKINKNNSVTFSKGEVNLHKVKYLCHYRPDNCNPVCLGIKGMTPDVLTRGFLLLQKAE
jgi:hypothetical protein